MREVAVLALRFGLELFEHVVELEQFAQPWPVKQHAVVRAEESDATTLVGFQRGERPRVDPPLLLQPLNDRGFTCFADGRKR